MNDVVVAFDESAFTTILHKAKDAIGQLTAATRGEFGPIVVTADVVGRFAGGSVDLHMTNPTKPPGPDNPGAVLLKDCEFPFTFSSSLQVDLNRVLPRVCLPRVCVNKPWGGQWCSPEVCINWPSVTIPFRYDGKIEFTTDLMIDAYNNSGECVVDVVILGVPFFRIDVISAAIIAALGVVAGGILSGVPFIGPFLGGAVAAIVAAIGVAGMMGLLGPLLSILLVGKRFQVYKQARLLEVIPGEGSIDPPVVVELRSVAAYVDWVAKDEFVIAVDFA